MHLYWLIISMIQLESFQVISICLKYLLTLNCEIRIKIKIVA